VSWRTGCTSIQESASARAIAIKEQNAEKKAKQKKNEPGQLAGLVQVDRVPPTT
jgi:hypothetical protein